MGMGRKIIFLDIDGVLRPMMPYSKIRTKETNLKDVLSERYQNKAYRELDETILKNVYYDFNGEACYCVRMLCNLDDVEIVLSTSWRSFYPLEDMKTLFALHKLGNYIKDITPMRYNNRSLEIQTYLDEHDDIDAYVIIDDIELESYFPGHCILTKDHLRMSQYRKGVSILLNRAA